MNAAPRPVCSLPNTARPLSSRSRGLESTRCSDRRQPRERLLRGAVAAHGFKTAARRSASRPIREFPRATSYPGVGAIVRQRKVQGRAQAATPVRQSSRQNYTPFDLRPCPIQQGGAFHNRCALVRIKGLRCVLSLRSSRRPNEERSPRIPFIDASSAPDRNESTDARQPLVHGVLLSSVAR